MWPRGKKAVLLSRLKIRPCGRRNARSSLVSLIPPEKETTWRVYFEGVKQPDSIIPGKAETPAATATPGVNVIWGTGPSRTRKAWFHCRWTLSGHFKTTERCASR